MLQSTTTNMRSRVTEILLTRNGATIEELTIERDKAETKLHTAKNDMKKIRTLNKVLT